MQRIQVKLLLLGLFFIFPYCCTASGISSSFPRDGMWWGIGFGGGSVTGGDANTLFESASLHLSSNAIKTGHLFSFRFTRIGLDSPVGDLALMYGRVFGNEKYRFSLAGGIGFLYKRYAVGHPTSHEYFHEVGLAWESSFFLRGNSSFSYGITGFGNSLGARNFFGLAVGFQFGKEKLVG